MSRSRRFSSIFEFLARRVRRSSRRLKPRPQLVLESLESRQLLSAGPNDLAALSDEFTDPASQANWQRVHEVEGWNADQLQVWDIDQSQPGRMVMQPQTSVWYQNWRGPMAFKQVSGDFVFTSEVQIADRDDVGGSDEDDVPGDAQFSLGGVMIRTPRPISDAPSEWQPGSMQDDGTNDGENYVFLSLGHGTDGQQFSLEVKTTRNSNSQLELTPLGSDATSARLRIARLGDSIIAMYQLPGQDWTVHRRYSRPDMPDTLQLGLVTYTDWTKANDFDPFFHNSHVLEPGVNDPTPAEPFQPDLVAGFEYARFARPQLPADLQGVDLVHTASDEQLLSFLGDPPAEGPDSDDVDPPPAELDPDSPNMAVGMNLINVADWSRAWVFRDAFKMARPWASRLLNTTTYEQPYGGELALDDRGWVTQLDQTTNEAGHTIQQVAQTYLFSEGGNPAGIYRAEWSGEGNISFTAGIVQQGTTGNGRQYALLELAEDQRLIITISETNAADHIRDIQLFMPDHDGQSLVMDNWQPGDVQSPFHPLFEERLQPFDTIRFMQWQEVNQDNRPVVTADHMRPADYATQATANGRNGVYGVSVEYMVELVNQLDANPWFNMPHTASDDYVRAFAEYVRDNTQADAQIYVEWSNEVWNYAFGFEANGWIQEQLQLPENAGLNMYDVWAREARRDFAIWHDVFAGQEDRIVRVAAGQQSTAWTTEQLLLRMEGEFDAVSSTSYSGLESQYFDWVTESTTEDDIIDYVLETSVPWSLSTQAVHVELAQQYSQQLGREIQFVTYEGGSQLSAYGTQYADLVQAALDSPGMRDIYETLLHGMQQLGVDTHTQYVFTGRGVPSPWGEFAVLRGMDMPLEEAHEYRALVDFIHGDLEAPVPTLSIVATDATAHELGDQAAFTVTRSGGLLLEELTVHYTVSGTASGGVDFQGLPGSVVIPAGETSATIVVSPLLDSQVSADEGNETITLTLAENDDYTAAGDGSNSATAILLDNEFVTVGDRSMGRSQDVLQIELPDQLGGEPAGYEAEIVDNVAAGLNAEHHFYVFADDFGLNWGGHQEKWVMGDEGYYCILPTAELFLWGGSIETSTLLAGLDDRFYDDPSLLASVQPVAVSVSVSGNVLTIDPDSNFAGSFAVRLASTAGAFSSEQTFEVTVLNSAPQLAAIEDQTLVAGSGPLTIDLAASDPDGDALSFEVRVAGSLAGQIMDEHHLYEIAGQDDYALNWGGRNEKWLQGDEGWYFLLPDGSLNLWDGSFEASTQLAAFSADVYEDPQLLLAGETAEIEAALVDGQLVVTPSGQTGTFEISLIASDGYESSTTSFHVNVVNGTPELDLADQIATAGTPLTIELPAVDADGHTIVYSVEVLGDELSALDSAHGFWSDGDYYDNYLGQDERWIRDAGGRWHYLLPGGALHRWESSFDASPLVAALNSEVYDDPSRLTNPEPAPVVAAIENGVLTVTAAEGYTGEVEIRVTASDEFSQVQSSFRLMMSATSPTGQ